MRCRCRRQIPGGTPLVYRRNPGALFQPGGRVSVVVPPSGRQLVERFQIDVKNATFKGGSGGSSLRIFGFAAMDPNRDNRAVLGPNGLNTVVVPSDHDKARVEAMRGKMLQVAERLG